MGGGRRIRIEDRIKGARREKGGCEG